MPWNPPGKKVAYRQKGRRAAKASEWRNLAEIIGWTVIFPCSGYFLIEHTLQAKTPGQQMLGVFLAIVGLVLYGMRTPH